MKKQLIKLLLLASTLIVLTNCKKFGRSYDAYFYADIEASAGPLTLFIDNQNKGELPNLKTSVSPTNDTILNNALHLKIKSGKYNIEAKDAQGNVKCSGTLKFRGNNLNVTGKTGGHAASGNDNTVAVKFYY